MLLNLHVKNLAIIQEVEVDFRDRLNILTGETGAGKSIIIGSINLALGGKVSKDIIRKNAEYALVELVFHIDDAESVRAIKDMDLPVDDGQVIISRKIMNGRNISKVNGENVTTSTLKSIAEILIDIHGQHEHQSLLYSKKHLDIIDHFAKNEMVELKEKIAVCFKRYTDASKKIKEVDIGEEERLRELSFLEYEINEIENARLIHGEEEDLEDIYKKMANADAILEGMAQINQILSGEDGRSASAGIGQAARILNRICEYDTPLSEFMRQLSDLEGMMDDFTREMEGYMQDLDFDREEFIKIENRLSLIRQLKAKYGNSIDHINIYCEKRKIKLEEYRNFDEYIETLKGTLLQEEKTLECCSKRLSEIRQKAAKRLVKEIKNALIDLNFLDVEFDSKIQKTDGYSSNGYDHIEFMISTNPGEALKPLAKVASGGELSRIMLAIKSVLADNDAIDTLIFDEIDVGVSGRTAQKVSEKLSLIAGKHQVICITHLPQIAAMADAHYVIEKKSDGMDTSTVIYHLTEKQSTEEIARLLGGAKITDNVRLNAKEMKELARATKLS